MEQDCLVCQELRLDVRPPGDHLVAEEDVVAFHLPPLPPASDVYLGYLLVTPRRHVAGFGDLQPEEAASMGRLMQRMSRSLEALGASRVYVLGIGHAVPHLHIHLVPRWPETPDDVSWLKVDEWQGARRGDYDAATAFALELRAVL